MLCGSCGVQWAVDDTDPPQCGRKRKADNAFEKSHGVTIVPAPAVATLTAQIPVMLTDDVALDMARVFETHTGSRADERAEAMRAAYRVFLSALP